MAGWTAREVARFVNVPANTVTSWIQGGLVTPDVLRRGRAGHEIGASALLELLAVVELKSAGISTQAIRRAVENLRQLTGQERPLARLTLVVQGDDIIWKQTEEVEEARISALHHPGQRLMIFPVGERHQTLLKSLEHSTLAPLETSPSTEEVIFS